MNSWEKAAQPRQLDFSRGTFLVAEIIAIDASIFKGSSRDEEMCSSKG